MSDPVRWTGQMPSAPNQSRQPAQSGGGDGTNLADILERVLDKGIVIAGDVQINLLDIELLTIKLRLIVASVDRAKEMGIDWWERDPTLSSGHRELEDENRRLRERLEALEGRNGQAALEGDEDPDDRFADVEFDDPEDDADDDADEDATPDDAVEVEDAPEPEPEPVKRKPRAAAKSSPRSSQRRRREADGREEGT